MTGVCSQNNKTNAQSLREDEAHLMNCHERVRPLCICLVFLVISPTLWANDLDDTISACGKPTAAFSTQDGKYDVEYKARSIWLKYQEVGGILRWYKAFDDRTNDDLSREQVLKRLPCSAAMLKANATSSATLPPPAPPPPSTDSGGGTELGGFIGALFLLALLGGIVWFDLFGKPSGLKSQPNHTVRCPKCLSSQIHAEKRGWSLLSGLIGSGKIVITCLGCGQKFKPGRGA
jgi:hypothetical protein